jgi:hypothetical protein
MQFTIENFGFAFFEMLNWRIYLKLVSKLNAMKTIATLLTATMILLTLNTNAQQLQYRKMKFKSFEAKKVSYERNNKMSLSSNTFSMGISSSANFSLPHYSSLSIDEQSVAERYWHKDDFTFQSFGYSIGIFLQYRFCKNWSILNEINYTSLNIANHFDENITSEISFLGNHTMMRYTLGKRKIKPYVQGGVALMFEQNVKVNGIAGLGIEIQNNRTTFHLGINGVGVVNNINQVSLYRENSCIKIQQDDKLLVGSLNVGLSYNIASSISHKNTLAGKRW